MAIMSAYWLTVLTVSARLSPFVDEDTFASENPTTDPPSLSIADSNDSLVLVDGSKKRVPKIFTSAQ